MRFHRVLVSLCVLACVSFSVAADEAKWCEVKSPNFTVISDASIKQARQVAKSLEQFRAVFQSTLPTLRMDPGFPLTVFAARDGLSLKALFPADRQEQGVSGLDGFFVPDPGKNIAVFRIDAPGHRGYHVMYHEYVHMAMNLNFRNLPLWLFEGLAEVYAFATISDGASGIGRTSQEYLEILRTSPMIPLPALMAATRDSSYYRQPDKSRIFYAQSWALTHYLILGDKRAHAGQLMEFLRLIKSEIPAQEAAERSFGDLEALQKDLEKYVRSDKFYYSPVEIKLGGKESKYAARKLRAKVEPIHPVRPSRRVDRGAARKAGAIFSGAYQGAVGAPGHATCRRLDTM